MKKKIISLFLAIVMCLSWSASALAWDADFEGNSNRLEHIEQNIQNSTSQKNQSSTGGFAFPDLNATDPGFNDTDDFNNTLGKVMGAIQWIGYSVAVIMVMYVGVKYLTAGVNEKAEVKKIMIPMLAGAILIVAATTIVSAIWSIGG